MSIARDLPDWARTIAENPCWDVEPAPDSPTIVVTHEMGGPALSEILDLIANANGEGWRLEDYGHQAIRLVFREVSV